MLGVTAAHTLKCCKRNRGCSRFQMLRDGGATASSDATGGLRLQQAPWDLPENICISVPQNSERKSINQEFHMQSRLLKWPVWWSLSNYAICANWRKFDRDFPQNSVSKWGFYYCDKHRGQPKLGDLSLQLTATAKGSRIRNSRQETKI